jgi:SDR family mycofactocin-dependent oxidoreductase
MEGKVSFITGAGRGQGRAHAVKQAGEGADIIAVDICANIPSVPYPLSSWEDLQETKALVEKAGRRCVAVKADVRIREQLKAAVDEGVAELGRLTTVVANAGVLPLAMGDPEPLDFQDAVDVDLIGVMNTVAVTVPHLLPHGRSASIIITGSTASQQPHSFSGGSSHIMGPGGSGYGWAKTLLIPYVEHMAMHLAPHGVRVNGVHPTNCDTHLMHNQGIYSVFRPDLEAGTVGKDDFAVAGRHYHAVPEPWIAPEEVADLALYLASDESRSVTAENIRIDLGVVVKGLPAR